MQMWHHIVPVRFRNGISQARCLQTALFFAALLSLCLASPAMAQTTSGQNVFGVATTQANEIFQASYLILEGIGVLGVLGVAAMAMTGRMPWGWAFAVMGALMLIKMAAPMRNWVQEMATTASNTPTGTAANNTNIRSVAEVVRTAGKDKLFSDGQQILYVFSGITVIALGILSMFGRFQWKWLAAVAGGLMILNWGGNIVSDFTGSGLGSLLTTGTGPTPLPTALGSSVANAEAIADRTAKQGQYIVYALGGLGVMGLAAMAMMGRFSWNWFFALVGGLMLVAGVSQGITYMTGGAQNPFDQQLQTSILNTPIP